MLYAKETFSAVKPDKIREILLIGENENIEFMTSWWANLVGPQVCAFLNCGGGNVVCGVNDDNGKIAGMASELAESGVASKLMDKLKPDAKISVELKSLKDKKVFLVRVQAGMHLPYAFNNQVYVRRAEKTIKADAEDIRTLILRRSEFEG